METTEEQLRFLQSIADHTTDCKFKNSLNDLIQYREYLIKELEKLKKEREANNG